MLEAIIVILILLWFLGYAPVIGLTIPNMVLITINNHEVTLWELIMLALIAWAIKILPRRFQAIASILLILWVVSILGIVAISGLSNIIVLAIIVALIASMFI